MTLPPEAVRHLSAVSLRIRCQEEPSGTRVAILTSTGCALAGAASSATASAALTAGARPVSSFSRLPHSCRCPHSLVPHSTNSSSVRPSSHRARFWYDEARKAHVGHGVRIDGQSALLSSARTPYGPGLATETVSAKLT